MKKYRCTEHGDTRYTEYGDTKYAEHGNALFIVLISVALLSALTVAYLQGTRGTFNYMNVAERNEQIDRMLGQASLLTSALDQMVLDGAAVDTLYSNLSTIIPGDGAWDSSPHTFKIYHPYGGGIKHMLTTGDVADSSTVVSNMNINTDSIVTGVGATDVTVGDILFTAEIDSAVACESINERLTGSIAMPTFGNVDYTSLFVTESTITISGANCAACVNISAICVENAAGTAWGYYQSLFPR